MWRLATTAIPFGLCVALSLSPLPVTGQSRGPGAGRPRWTERQRSGVIVRTDLRESVDWAVDRHDRAALSPRELRRLGVRPRGLALQAPSRWPAEPRSPAQWQLTRFTRALRRLCPVTVGEARIERIAHLILGSGREFAVDPALLAALVYQQSGCHADRSSSWGIGLTMLNVGMFPRSLRHGRYVYGEWQAPGWRRQYLELPAYPFRKAALRDPAANLYFAAAHLKILSRQCPHMDGRRSRPHRHPVSHFIWGDVVRDAGPEDRILEARRRLLQYYTDQPPAIAGHFGRLALSSPLDGAPRVASSGLGEPRDHGRRDHAGVDFVSRYGEPVRAVAEGEILYAGTDRLDGSKVNVPPASAHLVPPTSMGSRGLFVEVRHPDGLRSVYAHLASYVVREGQRVKRGQLLGHVGRSGIRASDPHLHFGLFDGSDRTLDPVRVLEHGLFGPDDLKRRKGAESNRTARMWP